MAGVVVNLITVVAGSLLGLVFRKGMPQKVKDAIMVALGICTVLIGIQGALKGENVLVAVVSCVVGVALGTLLDIDGKINKLGRFAEEKLGKKDGSGSLTQGMITAYLLWCVGAMTIIGSLQAGISGDCTTLYTKAMLDLISSMMLASSLGIGVLAAAIPLVITEGGLVLLAGVLEPLMSQTMINEITCVGSLAIIMLGLNLMGITKIKVADFLPGVLIAPFASMLISL